MWYKNIAGRFFGLVTKHACDRRTDGQNYDTQDRASIAGAVKTAIFRRFVATFEDADIRVLVSDIAIFVLKRDVNSS